MLNFCAVFNTSYLSKGLALHQSLTAVLSSFHLYIFALDEPSYEILTEKRLENATIIKYDEFEDKQLLTVKSTRSISEYCWTCKPFILKYCFNHYGLEICTYLDADLYFYNNPQPMFDEAGHNSVIITPHNFYSEYDQCATSGIYCAQLVMFRNDVDGMQVLNWWQNACLKWCSRYYEDGKWADQKYLDSWPYMFNNVHISRNKGAGLAPWNLLNYQFSNGKEGFTIDGEPLIFYHFHDLQSLPENLWYVGGYEVPAIILKEIYKPYINRLIAINRQLQLQNPEINALGTVIKNTEELRLKYKLGIYRINLKRNFRLFINSLFFTSNRRHYKHNYINSDSQLL